MTGEDAQWTVVELEAAAAARAGLPPVVVMPRAVAEAGEPLERPRAAAFAALFARDLPDHALAGPLLAFASSEPNRRAGEAALREGRLADAERELAQARELAPYDAATTMNHAVTLRRLGRADEALAELVSIAGAFDDAPTYHLALALTHEELADEPRAIDSYRRVLELAPGHPFALDRLAALGALQRLPGADGVDYYLSAGDLERVVRHELGELVGDAAGLVELGRRLLAADHFELARSAAELALRAADGDPDARALMRAIGEAAEARPILEEHVTDPGLSAPSPRPHPRGADDNDA